MSTYGTTFRRGDLFKPIDPRRADRWVEVNNVFDIGGVVRVQVRRLTADGSWVGSYRHISADRLRNNYMLIQYVENRLLRALGYEAYRALLERGTIPRGGAT